MAKWKVGKVMSVNIPGVDHPLWIHRFQGRR
jgi:hypothetical protein